MTDSVNSVSRLRGKKSQDRTLRSSLLIHKSEELRHPCFADLSLVLRIWVKKTPFGGNSEEHEVSSPSH